MVEEETKATRRQVNYPAMTWDYRLVNRGATGIGLVAGRNIKKGELVFGDSYEFMFNDVEEGDVLRLDRHEKASKRSPEALPATFPLTRELLTRTHGVPDLIKATGEDAKTSAGTINWKLECPGMLINHSCDPNVRDDSHDAANGEAWATRDIKRGEELCYDYTLQYYDHGPFFEECLCGAASCRGKMMGFKELSEEDKQAVMPYASEAVKAMHEANVGTGLPVKLAQAIFEARVPAKDPEVLRMVVPGPSHANADIAMEQDEATGTYALFATKDFDAGDQVYEFWTQLWPSKGQAPVDMVLSSHLLKGDPKEGSVVRVHPLELAKRDREGDLMFSGWDLFTTHSCDPNLVYNDKNEAEDDDWRGSYATRAITKGDRLSVDLNSILWDRTEWNGLGDGTCTCGASNCRGVVKGFRFLPPVAQEQLRQMSWNRSSPPHPTKGKKNSVTPGEALTPCVRASWRRHADTPGSLATSSSSDDSGSEEE